MNFLQLRKKLCILHGHVFVKMVLLCDHMREVEAVQFLKTAILFLFTTDVQNAYHLKRNVAFTSCSRQNIATPIQTKFD